MRKFLPVLLLPLAAVFVWWLARVKPPVGVPAPVSPVTAGASTSAGKSSAAPGAATAASPAAEPAAPAGPPPTAEELLQKFTAALGGPNPVPSLLALLASARTALSPRDHSLLFTKLGALLAAGDPKVSAELIKALQQQNFSDSQTLGTLVVSGMIRRGPESAAAWLKTLDASVHARQFYQTLGRDWAVRNMDGARGWINTLQENMHNQAAAVEGLADPWAEQDLKGLLEWAGKIEDTHVRGAALLKAVKQLTVTDPPAAAKLGLTFPDTLTRRQALESALTTWIRQSPDPAPARDFVEQIPDPATRDEARLSFTEALGQKNRDAAEAYVNKLPDSIREQARLRLYPSKP